MLLILLFKRLNCNTTSASKHCWEGVEEDVDGADAGELEAAATAAAAVDDLKPVLLLGRLMTSSSFSVSLFSSFLLLLDFVPGTKDADTDGSGGGGLLVPLLPPAPPRCLDVSAGL